jgi:hypothetical protein
MAIKQFASLIAILVLAACSVGEPPHPGERAAGSEIIAPPSGMERRAARTLPLSEAQQVDYLLVHKTLRILVACAGGQPVKV